MNIYLQAFILPLMRKGTFDYINRSVIWHSTSQLGEFFAVSSTDSSSKRKMLH